MLEKASTADVHYGEHLVDVDVTAAGVRVETGSARTSWWLLRGPGHLSGHGCFPPREFGSDMRMSAGGGVMVAIRPGRASGQALIAVRAPRREDFARGGAAQRKFVADSIKRAGTADDWHLPSALDAIAHDPGFYCDELVKVAAPSRSTGRAVLLADGRARHRGGDHGHGGVGRCGRGRRPRQSRNPDAPVRPLGTTTLKRWAPDTVRQARRNAMAMRMFTRTPLRRLLARAGNLPPWYA
ncbi:hypothetical protein A4R44_00212 [Amycolatopsis sp. M39]|nr:hypothetical protein A4R44_00212 [Amycolatopsis sp. M39]